MNRRDVLSAVGLAGAGLATLAAVGSAAAQDKGNHHATHFTECAKACAACQILCDACFTHCKGLLAAGKKQHEPTLQLCVDCSECCQLAATLTARMSPLAAEACECCARCCDRCAEACEKFPDDKHMAECAKSCRDCAKACREMIEHLKR